MQNFQEICHLDISIRENHDQIEPQSSVSVKVCLGRASLQNCVELVSPQHGVLLLSVLESTLVKEATRTIGPELEFRKDAHCVGGSVGSCPACGDRELAAGRTS